jgi:CheY-like chemotaxis protein
VAHNFNNLLQIIIGGAGVALEDLDHGEYSSVRNTIQEILDSARFGAETVKRLQTFARVRTEETPEQGALFDLSVTIRQALEMSRVWWKTLPEKQGVKISAAWNIEEDCIAKGREHEIFELAVNLIKNAVEAMPAGGDLRARVFGDETHVFFTLSDTGIGIAHDDLKRIFEPFFTTKGFRNTGMGLADAYGAALGHGGELSVRSALGEGTAFQLKLPRAHRAATNTNAPHDEGARPPLTILIVDDMAPVLSMLSHTLSKFATEVRIAQSGSEALAIIRETDVDLVLCDLGMPDMNGWMVGRSVKEYYESVGKPCPHFFLLTGWAGQLDETKQMAESGVLGIIEKPVDLRKLAKLVAQVASERAEKIALRPEFAF